MKTSFILMTTLALMVSACGGKDETPAAESQTPQNTATATATASGSSENVVSASSGNSATASTATASAECTAVINSDDKMTFNTKELNIKSSCSQFTVTLNHTGQTLKAAMGHNLVITKASDKDAVISDGNQAGMDKDYLKPDDNRVVVATKLLGGGESDTVSFPVSKLQKGENYVFFCSFPGHVAMMNGTVKIVD